MRVKRPGRNDSGGERDSGRNDPVPFPAHAWHDNFFLCALKNEMENTIANIRILDVVRLVHGYFIFVFLIINMLS
jgi:hypothetical protein